MTQKQKQRSQAKQLALDSGERMIAILNLIFGVPLALVLLVFFLREPIPRDAAGVVFGAFMFLFVFGLNAAGVCLLLRRRALARAFQWLTALLAALYLVPIVIMVVSNGLSVLPPLLLVGAVFVGLTTIALGVLLQRFGED